jgi:hypothetical protein
MKGIFELWQTPFWTIVFVLIVFLSLKEYGKEIARNKPAPNFVYFDEPIKE